MSQVNLAIGWIPARCRCHPDQNPGKSFLGLAQERSRTSSWWSRSSPTNHQPWRHSIVVSGMVEGLLYWDIYPGLGMACESLAFERLSAIYILVPLSNLFATNIGGLCPSFSCEPADGSQLEIYLQCLFIYLCT